MPIVNTCELHGEYIVGRDGPGCPMCKPGSFAAVQMRMQAKAQAKAQQREAEERYPLELQERQTAALESIAATLDILALPVRRYFQMEAIVEKHAKDSDERVEGVLRQARKEKG